MDPLLVSNRPTIHGKKMVLDPVRKLSQRYSCYSSISQPRNRPRGKAEFPQDVRFDGINQFRGPTSQKRCKIGKKNAKTMCEKYNVSLDEQRGKLCFEVYHTKQ